MKESKKVSYETVASVFIKDSVNISVIREHFSPIRLSEKECHLPSSLEPFPRSEPIDIVESRDSYEYSES